MNRLLVILIILISFLCFSCGRQKQEVIIEKTEKSKTENIRTEEGTTEYEQTEDTQSVKEQNKSKEYVKIKTIDANRYVGENAEVTGYVADVVSRPKVNYLNFDKQYPNNTFTAVIFPGDAGKFGDIEQFRGRTVSVRGKIGTFNGKPQIILNSKEQITIKK